jgi:hypothetical protein
LQYFLISIGQLNNDNIPDVPKSQFVKAASVASVCESVGQLASRYMNLVRYRALVSYYFAIHFTQRHLRTTLNNMPIPSKPPQLLWSLSRSPLMPPFSTAANPAEHGAEDLDALVTLLTKQIIAPLPSFSFAPRATASTPTAAVNAKNERTPIVIVTEKPESQTDRHPTIATVSHNIMGASGSDHSKAVLDLVRFLDHLDADMNAQVARIRESVAEVRDLAKHCRTERHARLARAHTRRDRERKETKEIDGDFWPHLY